jgi:glycosyltransferase involved in cell wall biosynthesis
MFDGASLGSPLPVVSKRHFNERTDSAVFNSCRSAFFVGAFPVPTHGSRGISEDLCARLSSAGWQMRIVSRHPTRIGRVLEMLWTSWRERHRYRVAAVDLYSGPSFFWAKAVCGVLRRVGKPYILMLHGGNLPRFAASRKEMIRSMLASAVAVTTPSRYLMEQMQPYRNDIQVLPNGISIASYPYKLRQPGARRLTWLRAFHEIYNPAMAVQVLALLKREFPDIHLTMIGPDKGDGSLQKTRQEAERLCVIENLTLLGSVRKEDVPEKLADGDIFLNTARIDNTPVSVLEAMAAGLCVVSTDVGGIPYLVRGEHEGLLVPPDSAETMAEAVRRIIIEPELSRRLSYNARLKAEQLDWSVILPHWEKLLSSVIDFKG